MTMFGLNNAFLFPSISLSLYYFRSFYSFPFHFLRAKYLGACNLLGHDPPPFSKPRHPHRKQIRRESITIFNRKQG